MPLARIAVCVFSLQLTAALAAWPSITALQGASDAPPPSGGQAPPTAPAAPESRPATVDELRKTFDAMSAYLAKKGALTADDHRDAQALVTRIRGTIAVQPAARPDPILWAMLAQIGGWTADAALEDEAFTRILALQPNNEVAMAQWVAALNRRGAFEQALAEVDTRFTETGKYPRVQYAIAETLVAQNRFGDAKAVLDTITMLPGDLTTRRTALVERIARLQPLWEAELAQRADEEAKGQNAIVELVTTKGVVQLELFEEEAPASAQSFVELVESGTYNGTRFHRRIPGLAVLGGDPNTKPGAVGRPGWGTVGWRVPDESARSDRRTAFGGTVGFCKAVDPKNTATFIPKSGGPQFFFLLQPAEFLHDAPLGFTTFGRIIDGFDVVASLQPGDEIIGARTVRKGPHEYKAVREPDLPAPAEMSVAPAPARPSAQRPTLNSSPLPQPGPGGPVRR